MFTPEEQQVEICLLKSSLAEIENELVVQRGALPALDAENEQQYKETMTALQVARTLSAEIERLNQQNVRLIARRMQLKTQCEDMARGLAEARGRRDKYIAELKLEETEEELNIRKYEDCLQEKADRFRKARIFYSETEMSKELANIEAENQSLQEEMTSKEINLQELQQELDSIAATVPEDVLDIFGRKELEGISREIASKCQEMEAGVRNCP